MKNGKHPDAFAKMIEFVNRLDDQKIHYVLAHHRTDTLMVNVALPGQRWEVEFFEDGSIEVEKFLSNGDIGDERSLAELFRNDESVVYPDVDHTHFEFGYAPA